MHLATLTSWKTVFLLKGRVVWWVPRQRVWEAIGIAAKSQMTACTCVGCVKFGFGSPKWCFSFCFPLNPTRIGKPPRKIHIYLLAGQSESRSLAFLGEQHKQAGGSFEATKNHKPDGCLGDDPRLA